MKRLWVCGKRDVPEREGTALELIQDESCSPAHRFHDDWRCGWAYEGSEAFVRLIEKYKGATRKPIVREA